MDIVMDKEILFTLLFADDQVIWTENEDDANLSAG